MKPIDLVRSRFTIVHGAPPKMRAKCPVHGSRSGSLSIAENRDGTVLLKCHAGCDVGDVVRAVGLTVADLFPNSEALQKRSEEHAHLRRQYARAPHEAVRAAIKRGIDSVQTERRERYGYTPPLRSVEINSVRLRVNEVFGTNLRPIAPRVWECPPHDDDPAWPYLFERARRKVMMEKYGDPELASDSGELHVAAVLAARALHDLSREVGPLEGRGRKGGAA